MKEMLKTEVVNYMKEIELWDDSLYCDIPSHWENYKGFIIFSTPCFQNPKWNTAGLPLWERVCRYLKGHSIAIKDKINNDSFRTPQVRRVYGTSSIVNYIDNKIKYTWDVEKIMFSAGNVTERHRIASLNCVDNVVVDLFAGIGYFTLPYLVHARAKFLYACEWNPTAVTFLRLNLLNNKVEERCSVLEGDNREVCPKRVADIVNLGLIPSSEVYWSVACEALLPTGGIMYIHQNVTSGLSGKSFSDCQSCFSIKALLDVEFKSLNNIPIIKLIHHDKKYNIEKLTKTIYWKHFEWFLFSLHISHSILNLLERIHCNSWGVTVNNVHKVKSYAPHIDHLVYVVTSFRS